MLKLREIVFVYLNTFCKTEGILFSFDGNLLEGKSIYKKIKVDPILAGKEWLMRRTRFRRCSQRQIKQKKVVKK